MRFKTDTRSLPRRGTCVLCPHSIEPGDETTAAEGLPVHRECFDRVRAMDDERESRPSSITGAGATPLLERRRLFERESPRA
jgi:hypothetical protein